MSLQGKGLGAPCQKHVSFAMCLPVGVDDLAEGQLAAHLQVALVLRQLPAGAATRVHLTVLIRLIQSLDEFS